MSLYPTFTPTEQRILDTLMSKGECLKEDLNRAIDDMIPVTEVGSLGIHLARIREKLRPIGEDVAASKRHVEGQIVWIYRRVRVMRNTLKE